MTNLQPLFTTPILEQSLFEDIHPGQASYVWRVRTTQEDVIVRTTRMGAEPAYDFWWGCLDLFGIQPADVFRLEPLNALLGNLGTIPVPQILRKAFLDGKSFVVVEKMPGHTVHQFTDLPNTSLEALGESLAHIHAHRFDECGVPFGQLQYPLSDFHVRMTETMRGLVEHYYSEDAALVGALPEMCRMAQSLPAPMQASLIMLDMDPSQFLADADGRLTALVDTEVYALGPCELDLIALEYVLDKRSADAFTRGYTRIRPLPDLQPVRRVYRYLYLLFAIQGRVAYETWMANPALF